MTGKDKIALTDAEGYLLCSICVKRFEPGDKILGQIKIEVGGYSNRLDFRSDPPIHFIPINQDNVTYLPHFHERCLL